MLTLFGLGFMRVAQLRGGGGCPRPITLKLLNNDNDVKFVGVVENH